MSDVRGRILDGSPFLPFATRSLCKTIFEVHDCGDDVEFQAVTLTFVAIALTHDFKGFDVTKKLI